MRGQGPWWSQVRLQADQAGRGPGWSAPEAGYKHSRAGSRHACSSAWRGRLLCAALCAARPCPALRRRCHFPARQRSILPSGPDTSAWLSPPEDEMRSHLPLRLSKASSRQVVAICAVRALRYILTTSSNIHVACRRLGPTWWWTVEISFFAGSNNFFLALRHCHISISA